jgi:hypothetical protein
MSEVSSNWHAYPLVGADVDAAVWKEAASTTEGTCLAGQKVQERQRERTDMCVDCVAIEVMLGRIHAGATKMEQELYQSLGRHLQLVVHKMLCNKV